MEGTKMKTNLIVFIAGDNDLDTFGSSDIAEMMSVENTGENLTILVQQDQSSVARDATTKRFVIRNGIKEETLALGETNTGDANTLTEFLKWGTTNYPAKRNIVVLWNHGGGTRDEWYEAYHNNATTIESLNRRSIARIPKNNPTLGNQSSFFPQRLRLKNIETFIVEEQLKKGEEIHLPTEVESKSILFDDESKDFLDNIELKKVFEDLGVKIDIIGFDACLMAMMEVAYQLRDYTEFVVGSEELEPGNGWNYRAIIQYLIQNPSASNEAVSKMLVESFMNSYLNQPNLKVSLSAIRTSKLKRVACLMDDFAHAILRKEPELRSRFLPIVDGTQTFDYKNKEQIYRDLTHFVSRTQQSYHEDKEISEKSSTLLEALDGLILINGSRNLNEANGLSVYLPLMNNMSDFAIAIFSALDINDSESAPHWLKLFKQIGNIDSEENDVFGGEARESCPEEELVEMEGEFEFVSDYPPVDSHLKFTDLVPIPIDVNEGLEGTGNAFMISMLGNPKSNYSHSCDNNNLNPKFSRRIVWGKDVGPFGVSGFDLAVDSLEEVMTEVADIYPELHAGLKSSGMLCCRLVRGSNSSISNHSWGTAIDIRINGILDGYGNNSVQYGLTLLAPIFNKHGWFWGATFRKEDGMHFEISKEKILEWYAEGKLLAHSIQKPSTLQTLRLGDRGEGVLNLQYQLNRLGYDLIEDGDFGQGTHFTVVDFQAQHDLIADGIVGKKTREALETLLAQSRSLQKTDHNSETLVLGMENRAVQIVQESLNIHGYALPENGVFDKLMLQAVKDFQENRALEVTGIVTDKVWEFLSVKSKGLGRTKQCVPILELGDANSEVVQIQARMADKGYDGLADGFFGMELEKSIRLLQEDNGLEPTGMIDEATRYLIEE